MTQRSLAELTIPIQNRLQLKAAVKLVQGLRTDPQCLLDWNPEADQPLLSRQRHELALAIDLVLTMGTGDGDLEARVKACQQLYARHLNSPAEAVRAAELLFRSRLVTGATDVETFWLAAAFAYALAPLASADLRETAWRYLCHAPFALDPHTAMRFARASRPLHRTARPSWPLDLAEALMTRAAHADLGATLLEAIVSLELEARSMEEAGEALSGPVKRPSQQLIEALQLLARYYVRTEADQVHARAVVRAAAYTSPNPAPFQDYLRTQLFELPYAELYELVKVNLADREMLDGLYQAYVDGDRLHIARRLVECELVRRLDPWRMGGIQPHIKRALQLTIGGADVWDARVRELAVRLAILHSRTRFVTEEAQHLARRIAVLPEVVGPGSPLSALREELELFLRESDPAYLLERERAVIADRWDELDDAEKRVMDDVQAWMDKKFKPRVEILRSMADSQGAALADAAVAVGVNRGLERALEKALWGVYRLTSKRVNIQGLKADIERAIGLPYSAIASADVAQVSTLARSFAYSDRALASAGGALAGLVGGHLGGSWGMAIDAMSIVAIATRSASRIGACFGIEPGTRAGFEFLVDALLMSCSTEAGEGLVAYLMDQRPRLYRTLTVGGVHYATSRTRRALLEGDDTGFGGAIARKISASSRILGVGIHDRQWATVVPMVGAVMAAGTDFLFVKELTEAALHLSARQWVLSRHGLLVGGAPVPTLDRESDDVGERRKETG